MRGRALTAALVTVLVTTTALPTAAEIRYEAGLIRTVDRTSLEQQSDRRSDDIYQVGKRRHEERGRHRGDRGRHRNDRGHHRGDRGRHRGDRGHHRGDRGRHRDWAYHRGDRGYRHRHYGHRGHHGYIKPRYRVYSRPYRYYDRYYYDDALGAFILGSTLGYILSQ